MSPMNTHTVCRHVTSQALRAHITNIATLSGLPLLTNFGCQSLLHLSLNPQLQMGSKRMINLEGFA